MIPLSSRFLPKANKFAAAVLGGILSLSAAQAELINQTASGISQVGWNDPALWDNTAPTGANDYQTTPGLASAATDLTINGQTWFYTAQLRTAINVDSSRNGDSIFDGNSVIVNTNTRIIGKTRNDATMTANIVLNGGYFYQSPDNTAGTPQNATLAGTISFGPDASIGAIVIRTNSSGTGTLTVTSSISGGANTTLQLGMHGGLGNQLTLTGDMSGFFGTIYAGITGVFTTDPNSFFSIQTDAVNATLQLDAWANVNFRYDLGSANQSFAAVTLNPTAETPVHLAMGQTYTAEQLNELIGGESKFFGAGSITVVPEPSPLALGAVAIVGVVAMRFVLRRRRAA